jgi:DNA polymerase-3 subunit epsilon
VEKAVPSFDEWMAARRAAAASSATPGDSCDGGAPRAPDERSRNGAPARRGRGAGRQAPLEPLILAGDEDALARMSWVVVVRDGRIAEVFETLVNPERSIPPMITQLTNISWEMVRDKPPFRDVAPRLVDVLKGHVFVAHNVSFDWKFVSAEVERATGEQLAGRRLCTVRLARRLLPELPRRTLGHLAAHFDADTHAAAYFAERHPDKIWRHRAAGDAVATAHCLLRMLDRARDHGCTTWGGLDTLLSGGTSRARLRRSALALPRPVDRDTTA